MYRQIFNKIRKTIHEQNEFNKKSKIIQKKKKKTINKWTEILELKNTMN